MFLLIQLIELKHIKHLNFFSLIQFKIINNYYPLNFY